MALNTVDGRASAIGVNEIYTRVYPVPDGSLNTEGDRMHVGLSYRLVDEGVVGPTPGHSYQHQGHDVGITGYKRSWSN